MEIITHKARDKVYNHYHLVCGGVVYHKAETRPKCLVREPRHDLPDEIPTCPGCQEGKIVYLHQAKGKCCFGPVSPRSQHREYLTAVTMLGKEMLNVR